MSRNTRSGRCSAMAASASRPLRRLRDDLEVAGFEQPDLQAAPRQRLVIHDDGADLRAHADYPLLNGNPISMRVPGWLLSIAKRCCVTEQHREPLARVAQAHAPPLDDRSVFAHARTIVDDGDLEHLSARASLDADRSAFLARRDRIFHGVLDQRLQQQAGHQRLQRRLLDRVLEAQPLAETQPLGIEIEIQRLDLLAAASLSSPDPDRACSAGIPIAASPHDSPCGSGCRGSAWRWH